MLCIMKYYMAYTLALRWQLQVDSSSESQLPVTGSMSRVLPAGVPGALAWGHAAAGGPAAKPRRSRTARAGADGMNLTGARQPPYNITDFTTT
jgi:hypothetical protein